MYDLYLTGPGGTLEFGMNSPYTIDQIEGLSPPEADIHLRQIALLDGQKYNGAKTQIRTLRIAFAIEGGAVEENRLNIYKCLRIKKQVTVRYKSDLLDVQISGYLQNLTIGHFDAKQTATAIILCPEPYWQSAKEIVNDLSQTVSSFRFPFHSTATEKIVFGYLQNLAIGTATNAGEEETGFIVSTFFEEAVKGFRIINYTTGDAFSIDYDFEARDELTVNMTKGQKSVSLLRDGETINLFNYITEDSSWLSLEPGQTTFVFDCDEGNMSLVEIRLSHHDLFEGV